MDMTGVATQKKRERAPLTGGGTDVRSDAAISVAVEVRNGMGVGA